MVLSTTPGPYKGSVMLVIVSITTAVVINVEIQPSPVLLKG